MVETRKRSPPTKQQTQRPKRRRLNQVSEKIPPDTTRTSPRLSKGSSSTQKKVVKTDWETSLPNATTALAKALTRIAQRGDIETRDLCDEIADCLTQALFEDTWHHQQTRLPLEESNAGRPLTSAPKSEETEQHPACENVERNMKNAVRQRRTPLRPSSSRSAKLTTGNPGVPSPSTTERKVDSRKAKETESKLQRKQARHEDGKSTVQSKEHAVKSNARKRSRTPKRELSGAGFVGPRDEGLVEEVVEIEEVFVDGGSASLHDNKKMLLGDDEEQVLDRSDTRSKPNGKMKIAKPGTRLNERKRPNGSLLGEVEEQLLDRSGSSSVPGSEVKDVTPIVEVGKGSPWWSISDSLEKTSERGDEAFRSYVTAVIRTCARESWNAESLRDNYRREPNSSRGHAFRSIQASLQLLERSRHMKECKARWRPELLRELLERQEVDWSTVERSKKFDHFPGCDACLGHRRAAVRLWFRGKRYDASNFWPGTSHFRVLTSEEAGERKLLVTAELRKGTTNDDQVRVGTNEDDTEFWVDLQCLRRCLLFHELVHSTAKIERDYKRVIEQKLEKGKVQLKLQSKESNKNRVSVSERLERHLLRSILHDKGFVSDHVDRLVDMMRLGDVYFSSPDGEVLDSGKPGKSMNVPTIYDAPLDLGDEEYKSRIDQIVAHSRRTRLSKHCSK